MTVLESRLRGWRDEKAEWRHRLAARVATRGDYDDWKRAIAPDVRACADRIGQLQGV